MILRVAIHDTVLGIMHNMYDQVHRMHGMVLAMVLIVKESGLQKGFSN